MNARGSDSLAALVQEIADLDQEIAIARDREEEARQEAAAARQVLDDVRGVRERLDERRAATMQALAIIQRRDAVSDETVGALVERARP